MSAAFGNVELDHFRGVIADRLGLHFESRDMDFLADVLRQRLKEDGRASAAYLQMLSSSSLEEMRVLATRLTVSETYFLRNPDHFRAFAELLPRMSAYGNRKLRILSSGCASGEEAYSLAITLCNRIPEIALWDIRISGIDVNPAMIEKALRARYSAWSLRETPAEIRNRYFRKEGGDFVLAEEVRGMVSFEERNLADKGASFWTEEEFDVIFCRNVIMYLVPDVKRSVVERLTKALKPGGFLFLGHADTLRGLSNEFHLHHTHDTFYYQKLAREARGATTGPPQGLAWSTYPVPQVPSLDVSWVEIIGTASDRIRNLSQDCGKQPIPARFKRDNAGPSNGATRRPPRELALALELLQQERFREALEVLREPAQFTFDADAQLLRAVLLTNCGEIPAAKAACAQLLAADDLNAGAHYLMALCCEHAGDWRAAMEQDRLAVHLDATFAIPHLHLGLLAHRSGDVNLARHELRQAVVLLPAEDASRILFFGGGFSREALLEFSRAQLHACGGLS